MIHFPSLRLRPLPTYHLAVSPQPRKRCATYGFTDAPVCSARGRRRLSARAAAEAEQARSLTDYKCATDEKTWFVLPQDDEQTSRTYSLTQAVLVAMVAVGGCCPLDQCAVIHLAPCTSGEGLHSSSPYVCFWFV